MKRLISVFLSLTMVLIIITGCGIVADAPQAAAQGDRLSIVSTIFPQYDWVREILGDTADDFDLTLVLNNRVDMHSFQPSVSDIVRISTADLLIYVGGHSDGWVEDALRQAINPDMIVINLMELLGDAVFTEAHHHHHHDHHDHDHHNHDDDGHGHHHHDHNGHHHNNHDDEDHDHAHHHDHHNRDDDGHGHHHNNRDDENRDHAHHHDHDHHDDDGHGHHHHDHNGHHHHDCDDEDCDHDHYNHDHHHHDHHHDHHHHHGEADEHVWLSLRNAMIFTTAIADALSILSPENAALFAANLAAYNARLSSLEQEYQAVIDAAPIRTLLFGDRFPFRYLIEDYNLDYYAAFPGCHAETEASFSTIIFLSGRVDELGLRHVVVTESADKSIARTIINNTQSADQQILVLDSMQTSNALDRQNGITYLSIMEENLEVLRQALS